MTPKGGMPHHLLSPALEGLFHTWEGSLWTGNSLLMTRRGLSFLGGASQTLNGLFSYNINIGDGMHWEACMHCISNECIAFPMHLIAPFAFSPFASYGSLQAPSKGQPHFVRGVIGPGVHLPLCQPVTLTFFLWGAHPNNGL